MGDKKKPLEGQVEHREREGVREGLIKRSQARARERMVEEFVQEQKDRMRAEGLSEDEIDDVFMRLKARSANTPKKKPH